MFKQIKGITGRSSVMGVCSVSVIIEHISLAYTFCAFFAFEALWKSYHSIWMHHSLRSH